MTSVPALTHNAAEFTELLSAIQEPAILLSPDYQILIANKAYRDTYGDQQPLHQRYCYEVSHHYQVPCDQAGESCPLKTCLETGVPQRVLHLHHTPNGEEHVDVSTTPIRNNQGEIVYFLEKMHTTRSASSRPSAEGLVGRSPRFNKMLEYIHRVAPSETSVLLQGESGTGKELVARAIHKESPRAKDPFVVVECSGLTESLFESELFGHEKGAFTGAHSRKIGLVEAAKGGTLFLDEVGDIPMSLQVKLLRLLETGTFRRVGSVESLSSNFRLVLASHRNLKAMVEDGRFRQDLYYRISTFPIYLPSLQQRPEDLPLLITTLLKRLAPTSSWEISDDALRALQQYRFPGNIRELRNILERAILLADGHRILPEHLPDGVLAGASMDSPTPAADEPVRSLEQVEQQYLQQLIRQHSDKDKKWLAEQLGLSERTLYRKLKQLKI